MRMVVPLEFFPTPVGTPGGKPLRLTARVKIARARPDRFWPAEPFFCVSVCVCVCVSSLSSQIWIQQKARIRGFSKRDSRRESMALPDESMAGAAARPPLLLLPTLSRPTLQVGVENSHVHEELLAEVCSSAAAPALLPPLGGRVQFLDSKQLGAAPYLVVHGDHMPRPPFVPVRLFSQR